MEPSREVKLVVADSVISLHSSRPAVLGKRLMCSCAMCRCVLALIEERGRGYEPCPADSAEIVVVIRLMFVERAEIVWMQLQHGSSDSIFELMRTEFDCFF